MNRIAVREYFLPTACRMYRPAYDGKASNRCNDTLDREEPSYLMRWNIMEGQADNPVYEVRDHEASGDIGRLRQVIGDIAEAWPYSIDH